MSYAKRMRQYFREYEAEGNPMPADLNDVYEWARSTGSCYLRQRLLMPDGSLTIGGFRDQAGPGEWSLDATPTETVQEMLETFVRTHLGVAAPITHRWAASAGYTESGLPVLEQVREGVWALGGYSGTGNVIGALSGRAVVAAALDREYAAVRLLLGERWSPDVTSGTGT